LDSRRPFQKLALLGEDDTKVAGCEKSRENYTYDAHQLSTESKFEDNSFKLIYGFLLVSWKLFSNSNWIVDLTKLCELAFKHAPSFVFPHRLCMLLAPDTCENPKQVRLFAG